VIAFSPDGQRVAVNGGGTDVGNALQIWNIGRKSILPTPSMKRPIVGLSFSRDGSYLAVSSPSLEVFDLHTNESVSRFDCGSGPALTPTFGPNGKWIAANCGGTVTVWPLTGGVEGFHFGETSDSSGPLLFSPDGRTLAAATSTGLALYDVASHRNVQDIKMSDAVASLAFSPNGEWLAVGLKLSASASDDKSLLLFDTRSHNGLWAVDAGRWVSALRFTPDGHLLAAAGDTLTRFELSSGRMIHRSVVKVPNGSMPVFSANGEWLAAGWNAATALWRVPMNN
jgi:WD40 repeat protein